MKFYESYLNSKGINTLYIDSSDTRKLIEIIEELNITKVFTCELDDDWLNQKVISNVKLILTIVKSPLFITDLEESNKFYGKSQKYFQTAYYIWQRKNYKILLDKNNEPVGGSWTYDSDNREKLPKGISLPPRPTNQENKFLVEAKEYVLNNYNKNPGNLDNFIYPITFEDSEAFLNDFLDYKLNNFGTYQDALTTSSEFVFHSVLSPLINTGLLNPKHIIYETIRLYNKKKANINSVEGFIRQIIGWREFFRVVYHRESRFQRTRNFWRFDRKIPKSWWEGTTGIIPVDHVIKKVLDHGYAHHIERLMVLGNFMLLCEFDPDDVYQWFMELFIDSYDWVMVPNVYGMSQYSDGGLITTKPYISSSNYIRKMSDYPKSEWCDIWDALFWRFISNNKEVLAPNPRMSMMVRQLEKMDKPKLNKHLNLANEYLNSL